MCSPCNVQEECDKGNSHPGKGWIYFLQGIYAGVDKEKSPEEQDGDLSDTWEQAWDTYQMIVDYYKKNPSQVIRVLTKDDAEGQGETG